MKLNHDTELDTDTMVFIQDLLTENYDVELQEDADGNEQLYLKFEHGASWLLTDFTRLFKKVLKNKGVINDA